ncbi:MAG: GAF domain-containing protein, partial [candidate division NC10 bacterium]|nr:GAF domain-containing protein [candidate division NC10 bacterium]
MGVLRTSAAPSNAGREGSKRLFPFSIRTHLTVIAIILTMGPVVIFGLVQARSVRDREISGASSRYQAMATSVAREIDFFISDAADNLKLIAGAVVEMKRLDTPALEVHIRRALDTRTINHIAVMTPSARSIVNLTRHGRLPTGVDYSDRPYFRATIASRAPQLSIPLMGRVSSRPEVFLSVPALDRRGTLKAVLVGGLDMTEIYKRHLSEAGTAEPLGRTLLLEPSGRPVAASDRTVDEVFTATPDVRIAPHVWESDPRLLAWTDEQGHRMVGASASLATWKWTILRGIPEDDLRETIITPIRRLAYTAVWLLVACLIVSPLVSHIMAQPIQALRDQARRLADGALGEQGTPTLYAPRELVDLSSSFNTMSAQLARNYREVAAVSVIAKSVSQSLDLHEILQGSLATIADVIALDAAVIFLLEGEELRVAAHLGLSNEFVTRADRMRIGDGFAGRVAESGAPLLVEDMWIDPRLRSDAVKNEGLHSLVSVPLSAKGRIVGVLHIFRRGIRQFGEDEVTLLTTIGVQIGVAVENAGLYALAKARLKEAEALAEISRQLGSSLDLQMVILTIVRWAKELCSSDLAVFAPYDPVRRVATVTAFVGARTELLRNYEIEPGKNELGWVLETGTPFVTDDYVNDPRLSQNSALLARAEGFVTKLAVPIRSRNESIGLLWVINRRPIPFTREHQEVLQKLATHAAVALENARLHQEAQDRLQETETLLSVGQMLTATLDLQEALRRGARELARALHADTAGAYLISPDGQSLHPFAGYHLPKERLVYIRATAIPLDLNRFVQEGFIARRPTFSPDCRHDPRWSDRTGVFTFRALLMVPFIARDEVIGSLFGVWWEQPHTLTPRELELADGIGRQLALAVENARLHQASLDRAATLAESEDRYRRLAEGATDLIFTVDVKGRFTYLNPRVEEILGHRAEELLGRPSIATVVPKDQDLVRGIFARALQGESDFDVYEVEAVKKDGSTIPMEVGASSIYDAEGRVIGRQGIARDLTERRRLEEEVRERKRLEGVNHFKSQFLANMSHELRTPMNAVLGFSEILRDRHFGPLTEKQARFVNNILVGGRHLLALINDILDLAKIEAGKMRLDPAPLALRDAITEVCDVMQLQAEAKHQSIQTQVDPDVGICVADRHRVHQILLNLLSNAIKFTPDAGQIMVTARRVRDAECDARSVPDTTSHLAPRTSDSGDFVEIAVADTGIGISPDDLQRLFQEFEQLEP